MKNRIAALSLFALLGTTPALCWTAPAQGSNSNVETGLQNFSDTSTFYQALVTTGVINQLNNNEHYTIFAPTNAAFARIAPDQYPCFYAVQCRPQIAALLRNHIIVGEYDLDTLVSYGHGIQSGGTRHLHVAQPYLNDYTVDHVKIISSSEIDGNMIYRIDGVISSPQELAQFHNPSPVMEKTTIVKRTYHPDGTTATYATDPVSVGIAPATSETTTITHSYVTDPQ